MAVRERSRSPRRAGYNTDEIVSFVFMREQARQSKDFAQADRIRDRLLSMEVTLFDKTNLWRANDGRVGKIPTWTDIESGASPESFLQEGSSQPMTAAALLAFADNNQGDQTDQIKHLVMQREQARASKDFLQSDQLRDELKALGVEIYDKEKMWRSKDGSSGVVIGYRSSGGPTDIEINALVGQREKARQGNDYVTADMIRTELSERGVSIFDKEKSWKAVDGRSGAVPLFSLAGGTSMGMGASMGMAPTAMGGGGGAVPAHVQQQIMQLALQHSQDPSRAHRALQMLQQVGQGSPSAVFGLGATKIAPTTSLAFSLPSRTAGLTAFQPPAAKVANLEVADAVSFCEQAIQRGMSDDEILRLVDLRERTRQAKDFASADALRDAMKKCGIELLEKEKRWQTQDGRQGPIPQWASLA